MTLVEAKPVFMNWANGVLGVWFPQNSMSNKFILSTSKVVLENMWGKYESTINTLFTDKDGNLTIDQIIDQVITDFVPSEGIKVNKFFGDNMFTRSISTKILERKDLYELKNMLKNGTLQKPN